MGSGILVVGEIEEGGSLAPVTGELLAVGRRLAGDTGAQVTVALLGQGAGQLANQAVAQGADRAIVSEDDLLKEGHPDALLAALEQIAKGEDPAVILAGRTVIGRDLAPRLAYRLETPYIQDCTEISYDSGKERVVANRPVYGGNANARVSSPRDPQFVCIRPKVFEPLAPDNSRQGEITQASVNLDSSVVKVKRVERTKEEATGVKLEEAGVVVGVGRGIGGEENVPPFQQLAQSLGAALGASRAVCDAGWLDHGYQIGLTGKTISPELYITWAISGASQHMAGCSNAKNIVAVNKDKDANIFKEARYGVVGDWDKVLKGFTEALKELGVG